MFISLIGFMGCGKSCVGKKVSDALGCTLTDLDSYIVEKAGKSIPEIFSSCGEQAFRLLEKESLGEILSKSGGGDTVISAGGGTVMTPACARMLKEDTLCIYLKAGIETLVRNLENDYGSRPMLKTGQGTLKERIEELMRQREAVYESTAAITVNIDGKTFGEVADLVMDAVREKSLR